MALLTAATRPAVGGGPSASDSGDCGIEDSQCGISLEVKTWSATGHPQYVLNISSIFSTYLLIGEMLSQLWSLQTHVHPCLWG